MSRSLFQIGKDLEYIEDIIEAKEGILDEEVDAYIIQQLETLCLEQNAKSDGYIHLIRRMEMTSAAAKAESQRYLRISQMWEAAQDRLKLRLKNYMQEHGIPKIETPTGRTIKVQKNGGVVPIVYLPDLEVEKLPGRFQKISVELDGAEVRRALEAGEKLPFAQMGERGTQLRISGDKNTHSSPDGAAAHRNVPSAENTPAGSEPVKAQPAPITTPMKGAPGSTCDDSAAGTVPGAPVGGSVFQGASGPKVSSVRSSGDDPTRQEAPPIPAGAATGVTAPAPVPTTAAATPAPTGGAVAGKGRPKAKSIITCHVCHNPITTTVKTCPGCTAANNHYIRDEWEWVSDFSAEAIYDWWTTDPTAEPAYQRMPKERQDMVMAKFSTWEKQLPK